MRGRNPPQNTIEVKWYIKEGKKYIAKEQGVIRVPMNLIFHVGAVHLGVSSKGTLEQLHKLEINPEDAHKVFDNKHELGIAASLQAFADKITSRIIMVTDHRVISNRDPRFLPTLARFRSNFSQHKVIGCHNDGKRKIWYIPPGGIH